MIRLGMKGAVVSEVPELLTHGATRDRLIELNRPACVIALEEIQAMERQRRQEWLEKISGRSAILELMERKKSDTFYGFGSAADAFKRAALGSVAADLVGQPPVILSGLESAADVIKRAALGTLHGFGSAADALKRWEQETLNARAQRGPELVPIAPAPILRIAPQPIQEPNLGDVIAELESHQQQVLDRWMAVYDRERITSASDKEAASKAAHLIAKNEGEKPGHVWIVIHQSLVLRMNGEQVTKQVISKRAADIARQKNAKERAWVLKEWESRSDLGQSKASFARQYAPLVKQRFGLLVTEETIKRDWLPKPGK